MLVLISHNGKISRAPLPRAAEITYLKRLYYWWKVVEAPVALVTSIIKCYNWMSTRNYLVWRCTAIPWHDVPDTYNKQVIVNLKILSIWLESCDVVIWQNLFRSLYRHQVLLTRCACGNKSYRVPVFIKTSTLFATKPQG